jgi:hypothetical protein
MFSENGKVMNSIGLHFGSRCSHSSVAAHLGLMGLKAEGPARPAHAQHCARLVIAPRAPMAAWLPAAHAGDEERGNWQLECNTPCYDFANHIC